METPLHYQGIPIFLRFSDVDRELSEHPKERQAIEVARQLGWRRALESLYDHRMLAYSSDPKRTKFLELFPLSKDAIALEIGLGFGQHTAEIASRVKRLDTLEVRLVNSMFAKIRCEQEGIENVTFACGGDDCRLPFPDASYDFVFLNLVLEWCAGGNLDGSAQAGQRRLLSEIFRVLKPGGILQLCTKNRFSYRLLVGGRDEHAYGMRFGSALPRWLLRLVLNFKGKRAGGGHLHSYGALEKLLKNAGLTPTQSYWAVPEMRFPDQFVRIDVASIRLARRKLIRQCDTRLTDILMRATPACLVHWFTPGLFFVAKKI